MQYEYEMFFDDTSPVSIHGWWPIATDRIKDQSRIQEYIDKGILRRIDMKEQNSAHGFTEGSEVPKEQDVAHSFDWITHEKAFKLSCPRPTIPPEKLVYQHAVMELKKADAELTRLRSELQTLQSALDHCKEVGIIREDLIAEQKSELQQERELKKELVECIESYIDLELFANPKPIESLIEKSKAK